MEEPGRVTAVNGSRAEVEIEPGPACDRCGASGFCNWTGKRSRLVLTHNEAGARVGDEVIVSTPDQGRYGSAGMVFGLLGGAMALGIIIGYLLWGDAGAAILAGGGLILGFGLLKLIDARRLRTGHNLPVVVRRCRQPDPD